MTFNNAKKPNQPPTILLVMDDLIILVAYSDLLEGEGYNVLTATNTSEAKEKLIAQDIDLLLIPLLCVADDFVKSGKSSVELFQDENMKASIPKVLITVFGVRLFEEVIHFLQQTGIENMHLIEHPISSEKLIKIIRHSLGEE